MCGDWATADSVCLTSCAKNQQDNSLPNPTVDWKKCTYTHRKEFRAWIFHSKVAHSSELISWFMLNIFPQYRMNKYNNSSQKYTSLLNLSNIHILHTPWPHLVKLVCWAFVHPKLRDRNKKGPHTQPTCIMMQPATHSKSSRRREIVAGGKRWKTAGEEEEEVACSEWAERMND